MHFQGRADFAHEVPLDFGPPLGAGEGIKPMELVLMSLAACSGQTVISLLEKMRQDVKLFSVRAEGRRQEEHRAVFTGIRLEFEVVGRLGPRPGGKSRPACPRKNIARFGDVEERCRDHVLRPRSKNRGTA